VIHLATTYHLPQITQTAAIYGSFSSTENSLLELSTAELLTVYHNLETRQN